MSLAPGKSLTHYEILGPLGAGGMGEVYRARDTRLEREVAIKVLPEDLADDAERLRRFEREAKTLASLNHPNVAGIHGVDQEGDTCFLALELVPGEDLATKLGRGALPMAEALDVCRQIAEGLEAAHEAGVVHRDLKPANVRITPEGMVKILDFGLAKPMHPKLQRDGSSAAAHSDSFLMTEEGLVMGTPTYMSPEQARGKPVDRRTDIWAFGCVLYECLTGRRAFSGASFTDVVAAIVGDEPDWSRLPPLPARVNELLRRALAKDPRERLRDMGEARMQLQLAKDEPAVAAGAAGGAVTHAPQRMSPVLLALFIGLAFVLGYPGGRLLVDGLLGETAGESAGTADGTTGPAPAAPPRALDVVLAQFDGSDGVHEVRISPDATHVAWADRKGLHVRSLGKQTPLTLTEEGRVSAFDWSPDSTRLAYVDGDGLWISPRDGGRRTQVQVQDLDEISGAFSWEPCGLVFSTDHAVLNVPVDGGEAETLLEWEPGSLLHMDGVLVLPDDRGLLCVPHDFSTPQIEITWYHGGQQQSLLTLPGARLSDLSLVDGRDVFFKDEGANPGFWRVPLSTDPVELGRPVRLPVLGEEPSVARDGTLVFLDSESGGDQRLAWVDLDGAMALFGKQQPQIGVPQLSSDGRSIVYTVLSGDHFEVWVHELERDLSTKRLQPEMGMGMVSFLADGRLAVGFFGKDTGTYAYPISGQGEGEQISERIVVPLGSPSDRYRFAVELVGGGRATLSYEDLVDPASEPTTALDPDAKEYPSDLSPDGDWLLYITERTGEKQLHLASFPPGDGRDWNVTADGCQRGWFDLSRQRILFTRLDEEGDAMVWSVSCVLAPEVRLGRPEPLVQVPRGVELQRFDPVGERFLGVAKEQVEELTLRLVTNWGEG